MCLTSYTRLVQACSNGGRRLPRTARGLCVTFAACPMAKTFQIQEVEKRISPFHGEEFQSHIAGEWTQGEDDMWLF